MAKGMQQWVQFVQEDTYGHIQVTSPHLDWIRLHQDDAFTVARTQATYAIRGADARNRRVVQINGRQMVRGKLTTYAYADFASPSLTSPVDRFLGLATALTSDELGSFAVRHWDGIRNREWWGGKVESLTLSADPNSNEGCVRLEMDMIFQRNNPTDPVTFTEPAQSVFSKAPYVVQEAAGGIIMSTSGSGARTVYRNYSMTVKNILQPSFDENLYITDLTYNGRDVSTSLLARFVSSADRTAMETQQSYTITSVFTKASPAHTLTLTHNAANFLPSISRSLKLGDVTYEQLNFESFDDTAAGGDFSYGVT